MAGDVLPESLIGERIAGRFVVERLIGRGSLSTAFRAHDERLHRRVTVKLFHPQHRDDEIIVDQQLATSRAVARLSHENVAMIIDRSEHDGRPLLVLEHVRGENLQERIDRYAPLAIGEVHGYALQIARALTYTHGHGVVHGNLRPENVLLTEERAVKLVDFGGGSYVSQLVGDPYSAPELRSVDAGAPSEPQDDVFALGVLLVAALTEQPAVPGMTQADLLLRRPDLSPRLAGIIQSAVSVDPSDRQESMRQLAAELASVPDGQIATEHVAPGTEATRALPQVDGAEQRVSDRVAARRAAVHGPRDASRPGRRRKERSAGESRARLLAWAMVIAPLIAIGVFGLMIAGERGAEQVDGRTTSVAGPVELVPIADASSFDPEPEGDGAEREDLVALAHDGDVTTSWQTEGYDVRDFIEPKQGVGITLDLGVPRDVRDVAVLTSLPGWIVQVHAAATLAPRLDGWRPVSEQVPVASGKRIPISMEGTKARYLLLWITRLSIDTEDTNRSRARIDEVRVFAAGSS